MKIFKQRNTFYIDLKQKLIAGYTELHIKRDHNENKFSFKSCCLDIASVEIISPKYINIEPKYTAKGKLVEKMNSDGFDVIIPNTFKLGNFILRIVFKKEECAPGIIFYEPVGPDDLHREMIVETPCYAFPYIEQNTYMELIYILPNNRNVEIVSSGKFVSFNEKSKSLIYIFEAKGINPSNVIFSVGTYQSRTLVEEGNLYLPSNANLNVDEFLEDAENIHKFMSLYSELTMPNVIFSMANVEPITGKNIIILSVSNLGRPRDVEVNFDFKETFCSLLCEQIFMFFNHALIDSWIFQGLSGYLSDMTLRFLLGHNEFLSRFHEDKEFVIENDVIEPPLFYGSRKKSEYNSDFFKIKSKLIFHAIHNQLSAAFMKKIILAVIKLKTTESILDTFADPKDLSPPVSNISERTKNKIKINIKSPTNSHNTSAESTPTKKAFVKINERTSMLDNIVFVDYNPKQKESCFTPYFIKTIKDSSGKDLKSFFDFYVFNTGLLIIDLNVKVNSKKGNVTIETRTTPTSRIKTANTTYFSFIKIKSVETDGTFNQKVVLNQINTYGIHKKTDTGTVLFIRADCKRENLCKIRINQPESLFIEQMLDKNVIGQFEAADFFKSNTSRNAVDVLERVAENTHTFYKVKEKIYQILKNVSISDFDLDSDRQIKYNGLMRLIQFFIKTRCVPNSTVLKNTETGLLNFYNQKALVKAITDYNDQLYEHNINNKNAGVIISFLTNILNYNDTTKEHFDDPYYLANILNKMTIFRLQTNTVDQSLLSEIERFRLLDMVFPSPKNIITRICLICMMRLHYEEKITLKYEFLKEMTKYPNYIELRIISLEALFLFYIEKVDFDHFAKCPFMLKAMLKIIIKMVEHGFRGIKTFLKENNKVILSYYNKYIGHELREMFEIILSNIVLSEGDYIQQKVFNINYALENKEELDLVVEKSLGNKRIVLVNFLEIKQKVFKKTLKLRLPYTKKEVVVEDSEHFEIKFMVTMKYTTYRPIKVFNTTIIRLLTTGVTVVYRNCDLPYLIIQAIKETKSYTSIEKQLRAIKQTDKYDSEVVLIRKLEEIYSRDKCILSHIHKLKTKFNVRNFLEDLYRKCIRYIFLYVPVNSKIYLGCKSIINAIDKCIWTYSHIQKEVTLMNDDLRNICIKFTKELIDNDKFANFVKDVNTDIFRNYNDVVKHPMSLEKILKRLVQDEEIEIKEKEGISNLGIVKYMSFDCFYYDLERVAKNAMLFNVVQSPVYNQAQILKEEINLFKSKLNLVREKSLDVLNTIFKENDTKNCDLDVDWSNIKTWNELDEEMMEIKKKYSRYSVNGRLVNETVNKVRKLLEGYFYINNFRVTNIVDD